MPPSPKRAHRKNGKTSAAKAVAQSPMLFDADKIKRLYTTMLACRVVTERAHLLVQQDKLPADLGVTAGQEAAEVGALIDLLADDCVALGRRDLTARLIRSVPLKTIFADLYARRAAGGDGLSGHAVGSRPAGEMIVPAFPLSAQLNLVTGVAWSLKRHGKPNVAVAFSGNDAAALASWREAVEFSVLNKLPIVHVVDGNTGDSPARSRLGLPREDSATAPRQPSIPSFIVDGNDVVAVNRVAQEAIRRARQGYGPALIECQTSRWPGQLNSDSPNQPLHTLDLQQAADPIARMEAYLAQSGLWSEKWKRKLTDDLNKKLDHAVDFAEKTLQRRRKRTESRLAPAS